VLAEAQAEAAKSGLIFTDSDPKFEIPQIELKLDHDKANRPASPC
jgi:multidrug efflux pump